MKLYKDYKEEIEKKYQEVIDSIYRNISEDESKMIRRAFEIAEKGHRNQIRKSGEPYIFHPLEVAKIVATKMSLGPTSVACAFLHDVVEDTEYTIDDIAKEFPPKIIKIVEGLTKIGLIKPKKGEQASLQAENFRKIILTLSQDIRVILIKLADRLHNMMTMEAQPKEKQLKISLETMYIFAPIAHRLGLYNIKTILEDISLKYINPEKYYEIENKILADKPNLEKYIKEFAEKIEDRLKNEGIDFIIKSRIKSVYSIYKKNVENNISFDEIYDKLAIRIVYKSEIDDEKFIAWKIYSIVTDYYKPNPSRLRDWISSPKANGYESLHITVMGPEAKWVEVQIRSNRMDQIAEKGYAAHYLYKHEESIKNNDRHIDYWLSTIKETLENPDKDSIEFLEEFKLSLYSKEIYVFSPKGDLISMPKGSTPLDFAFAIHTDLGLQYSGAKINGSIVPIKYQLKNGDKVEITTSKNNKPSKDWIFIVKTSRARNRIKNFLKKEMTKGAVYGEEIYIRKLKRLGLVDYNKADLIDKSVLYFGKEDSSELFYDFFQKKILNSQIKSFYNFYTNKITVSKIKKVIKNPLSLLNVDIKGKKNDDKIYFGDNREDLNYSFAQCCSPKKGDDIYGFITKESGIKVHKKGCINEDNMIDTYSYRIIPAFWTSYYEMKETKINIYTLLKEDTLNSIFNFKGAEIKNLILNKKDNNYEIDLNIKFNNSKDKNNFVKTIKKLKGVQKVVEI